MPFPLSPRGSAALWAIASAATFTASSGAAKFLGQALPATELAFLRAGFGVALLFGAWRLAATLGKPRDVRGHLLRCGLGIAAAYSFMYALTTIPLALATLIFITRVLLLPVAGRLMLGERSGWLLWGCLLIGVAGAGVTLWPSLTVPEFRVGILAAVLASVTSAGSQTAVRRLTASNSPEMIVLIYTAFCMAALAPTAAEWVLPPMNDWPALIVFGVFAVAAQLTAARAYAKATVAFLAPFDLLTFPAAALIGCLMFEETPSVHEVAGGSLVIASAAAVSWLAGRKSRLPMPDIDRSPGGSVTSPR
ncbi:DMT family transporter [Azospirillum picis]|uniref:Drug/metabolite transporter (DMT)-like permease n=1 Tax=Azospirillum picis TaxID=488438 RepID=A0ABU0ME27_9PROT|nr:DMT family transporter [Azospirillum picis]MBP2297843.1 drug/metabolite transporter (DMT)-like permease [Azospirillum picis]MDQ0531681.1 drug/metabolite transporter (DMT)-like permease [Azospirillum picis]